MYRVVVVSAALIAGSAVAGRAQDQKGTSKMSTVDSAAKPTPLFLERDEGARRVWRPLERDSGVAQGLPSLFILKVDQHSGGSSHIVFGTEPLEPGGHIETHKHPSADEILFIQSGTARVMVGGIKKVMHAGATVFIPAGTWLSVANIGPDTIGLAWIFSAPGFDDFMRAESAPEGQKPALLSKPEDAAILKKFSHVVVYMEPAECAACSGGE